MLSNQVNCWMTPHLSKHAHDSALLGANNEPRKEIRKFSDSVRQHQTHAYFYSIIPCTNSQDACLFPRRAYLAYTSVFCFGRLQRPWPGAIYQNNLLSGENLLLTDKSLPSVGCNGSHLSFFSEDCPSRPPPRQTQLNDCSLFSLLPVLKVQRLFKSQIRPGPFEARDFHSSTAKKRHHSSSLSNTGGLGLRIFRNNTISLCHQRVCH